jgi:hypothetical protein
MSGEGKWKALISLIGLVIAPRHLKYSALLRYEKGGVATSSTSSHIETEHGNLHTSRKSFMNESTAVSASQRDAELDPSTPERGMTPFLKNGNPPNRRFLNYVGLSRCSKRSLKPVLRYTGESRYG